MFKKDTIHAIRDKIGKVESAIANGRRELDLAAKTVDKHKAERSQHLRSDPEAGVPTKIRQALASATASVTTVEEEIAEHETHLGELRAQLAVAEDQAEREETARADEALADVVDTQVAPNIRKAAELLALAARAFRARAPEDLRLVESRTWARPTNHPRSHSDHYSPDELLVAVIAESIAAEVPGLFETEDVDHGYGQSLHRLFGLDRDVPEMRSDGLPPPAMKDAAKLLLSDRLRARAAAARAGRAA